MTINKEKYTILLPIYINNFEDYVEQYAEDNNFIQKKEFHLSIISFQVGKVISQLKDRNIIFEKLIQLTQKYSWNITFEPRFFLIEKYYDTIELEKSGYMNIPEHKRITIVQKVDVPDLELFYKEMSIITGVHFEVPFSHVTLYSCADYEPMKLQGIGLYSEADFNRYMKKELGI
jgi:hypothetical protein